MSRNRRCRPGGILSTIVEDSEVFRESPAPPGGAPTDSRGLDPGARLARSPGMLLQFFTALRDAKVPVSLKEYLTLLGALDRGLAEHDVEIRNGLEGIGLWRG